MKLFLKKILIFILSFFTAMFLVFLGSNYLIKKKADFKLNRNINKVILGNSQPECAYNDSLISDFKNLAKPGETYFYNYQKLKAIVEQNQQIDSVFIEFSNANILRREDQKIWETRFLNHALPDYVSILHLEDYYLLFSKNPVGFQKAILTSLKNNIVRISTSNYNYKDSIGGYKYLKRQKVNAILDTLTQQNHKFNKLNKSQLSQYDILYLENIITLCKANNISVFLIRSPYHKQFIGNTYESSFQQFRKKHFGNIKFFDFKDFSIQDSEFGDLQHLNYKGARKFSLWFNTWLQE